MSTERPATESTSLAQPGKILVRQAGDNMEVYLTVVPPTGGAPAATTAQVTTELAKMGIAFGVDRATIEQVIQENSYTPATSKPSKPVVIARGKAPVRGKDAVLTHHELLQTPQGYPLLKEDGKVDFFHLNLVRNVLAGTLLSQRQPATKGVPGTNVLGAPVPAQDGREFPLKVGKGAKATEDGLGIIAEVDGHAVMAFDGKVSVSQIFEVIGDVDTSTGNIEFVGTVVVRGNINAGFTVKADQNVQVHGGIDGGTVEAGGDVTVAFGIQGANRGKITAGGQVKCRFMENADVRCRGDLTATDGVLHSRVRSGGKVVVTGRRGSIIGGSIKAKDEVSSRIIGSNIATVTEIEVGVSPESRDELEQVRRSLHESEESLRKSQQAVTLLRDLEAKNPVDFTKEKRDILMRSLRSQYFFQGQRDQMLARKAILEAEVELSYLGRVRAHDMAYPGVKIIIGTETYQVIDLIQNVCFYLNDVHEVTFGPA